MEHLIKHIIKRDELNKPCRKRVKVHKRMFLFNLMKDQNYNLKTIGKFFNKDHSTVIHGIKSYHNLLNVNDFNLMVDIEEYLDVFGIDNPINEIEEYGRKDITVDIKRATTIEHLYRIKRRLEKNYYKI